MLVFLQMIDDTGDRLKLEQLYHKYRNTMFYIANSILKNPQDAEDAVQDAFLSVAKNISKISDIECPKTKAYLVIIVENKAIDMIRKRKKEIHKEEIEELEDATDSFLPESGDHDLKWCIDQLPSRYREVILLKYSHGYSTQEISEILGISLDAASKLDQRAKKRLEDLCRKEEIL